jgi:hypothetical protein
MTQDPQGVDVADLIKAPAPTMRSGSMEVMPSTSQTADLAAAPRPWQRMSCCRGARLRRAKPVWLYGVAVVAFAVLLGVFLMMKH